MRSADSWEELLLIISDEEWVFYIHPPAVPPAVQRFTVHAARSKNLSFSILGLKSWKQSLGDNGVVLVKQKMIGMILNDP
jgi:hypothetical protein